MQRIICISAAVFLVCVDGITGGGHVERCPRIPLADGNVTYRHMWLLGGYEKASFACNQGFQLQGYQHAYCIHPPVWSGRRPSCTPITCRKLTAPSDGSVGQPGGSRVMYGENATFSCNSGFVLRGSSVRTCGGSGVWSGTEPSCVRERMLSTEGCHHFQVAHGNVTYQGMYGEYIKASVSCNRGYKIRGHHTYCIHPPVWSGRKPTCKEITCSRLPAPSNGKVSQPAGSRIVYGQKGTFSCNSGFTLLGSPERACGRSGEWSGIQPSCPRSCLRFGVANGEVTWVQQNGYEKASVSCNKGYRLHGDARVYCIHPPVWSGRSPSCVREIFNHTKQFIPEVWREGQVKYLIDDCDIVDDEAKVNLTEALKETFYQEGVCPQINKLSCKIEDVSITCGESDRPWIPSNIVSFSFNITRDQLPLSRVNCGVYCNSVRQPDQSCLSTCYNSSRSEVNRNINSAVETLQDLFAKHGGNNDSPGLDGSRPQTNGRTKPDLLLGTTMLRPATSRVRIYRMNMLCGGGTVPTQNGFCIACQPGSSTRAGALSCWP